MVALQEIKSLLSQCLKIPVSSIADDADINTLENMDSLTFELIAAEMEEKTGREIDIVDFMKVQTVRDLASLLAAYRAPA